MNTTTILLGFMVVVTIVRWDYKPTYNWGVPHTVELCSGTVVTVVPPGVKRDVSTSPIKVGMGQETMGKMCRLVNGC